MCEKGKEKTFCLCTSYTSVHGLWYIFVYTWYWWNIAIQVYWSVSCDGDERKVFDHTSCTSAIDFFFVCYWSCSSITQWDVFC